MELSIRKISSLVLDERVCWSTSVFDDDNDCNDCENKLMHYHVKNHIQKKAYESEKKRTSDSNDQSEEHTETDENDDSDTE